MHPANQAPPHQPNWFASKQALPVVLALCTLLLHLATNGGYGYHRDELYYIACGQRLDWGYVDHPPLTPLLARIMQTLGGEWLAGLRSPSAFAHAALVWVVGAMTRTLGGGRFAQGLACLCTLFAPLYLAAGGMLQPVAFDQLAWGLMTWLVLRLLGGANPRLWLLIGALAGVGLMNKNTVALFIGGLGVGLLCSSARRQLRSPWLWAGLGVAILFFLPNLLWQTQHDWATLEFYRNLNRRVAEEGSRLEFLAMQVAQMHPFALPVWGRVSSICCEIRRRVPIERSGGCF